MGPLVDDVELPWCAKRDQSSGEGYLEMNLLMDNLCKEEEIGHGIFNFVIVAIYDP